MHVTHRVAMEIACPEAVVRQAYFDSVGVLTWSVGLTSATGHRVDRYLNNPQPLQHCLDVYVWALKNYARQVQDIFADHPLTEAQFAAALSFHWNTGAIRASSWVDRWKRGDMAEAERRFKTWNKAGGKVSSGLVARRDHEADLLFRGIWANDGTMTEYPVTASNRPDFRRGFRIRVDAEMAAAFGGPLVPVLDTAPQPDKIPASPTLTPMPLIKRGSKGAAVRVAQELLDVAVDGDFGAVTERAARQFQRRSGLKVDGIIGARSWTIMQRS